jgi:hypothetical protein
VVTARQIKFQRGKRKLDIDRGGEREKKNKTWNGKIEM